MNSGSLTGRGSLTSNKNESNSTSSSKVASILVHSVVLCARSYVSLVYAIVLYTGNIREFGTVD